MLRRRVVGCMTGTSIDAVDAALVEVEGFGLGMRARVVASATREQGALAGPLRRLATQEAMSAGEIARLSLAFSELHVEVIRELLSGERKSEGEDERGGDGAKGWKKWRSDERGRKGIDLIAVHGQTVFHAPPASWQLITPWPIAREFGCELVFDMRGADLAAGGQGAPITPMADYVFFRHEKERRAVVNLGGFSNYTILAACGEETKRREEVRQECKRPQVAREGKRFGSDSTLRDATSGRTGSEARSSVSEVRGGDICVCNQLLDLIARERMRCAFDEGGEAAKSGTVRGEALAVLRALLERQARAGRSLGTGDEVSAWVADQKGLPARDVARTACEAIGATIAGMLAGHAPIDRVIVAGGGARNAALVGAIRTSLAEADAIEARRASPAAAGLVRAHSKVPATGPVRTIVETSEVHGVPISQRESAAMAVLGALSADGVRIALPSVTGAGEAACTSGTWVKRP